LNGEFRIPTDSDYKEEDSLLFPTQQDSLEDQANVIALSSRSYRMPNIEKAIMGKSQSKSVKNSRNRPRGVRNSMEGYE